MKKTFSLLCFIFCFLFGWSQQLHPEVVKYIEDYKDLAISEMRRTGVPASIKLAQGIHETMAGKSALVLKSNNHFGIKCKTGWDGLKFYHDDDAKNECFRGYKSAEESYIDHSNFLKNSSRYSFLFGLDPTDYVGWANGLKSAGYATNPKYPGLLINLIETYQLQQYTFMALAEIQIPNMVSSKPAPTKNESVIVEQPKTNPVIYDANTYSYGEIKINSTRAIYVEAGSSLFTIAQKYNISYKRLLEYNDLTGETKIEKDQLIFLQRKKKQSHRNYHIVGENETLHDIAQKNAIRLENLLEFNHLNKFQMPAVGEQLYLKTKSPRRPLLVEEARAKQEALIVPTNTMIQHIVRQGETLYSIARDYGVSIEQIKTWNRLTSTTLSIGQKINIKK